MQAYVWFGEMVAMLILSFKAMVGKDVWLDPTAEEATHARGSLTLACMPALGSMTSVWQTGQMTIDESLQVNDRQ